MSNKLVNVIDSDGHTIIARVKLNSYLDFWNGHNFQSDDGPGRHKGLTKLADGRFVLIHDSDYEGDRPWAEVISPEEALQQILWSGKTDLLEKEQFSELKQLAEEILIKEVKENLEG